MQHNLISDNAPNANFRYVYAKLISEDYDEYNAIKNSENLTASGDESVLIFDYFITNFANGWGLIKIDPQGNNIFRATYQSATLV